MTIKKLDHVNVRTNNLPGMIEWYGDVLGMPTGKRPNFSFPGAWLYAGDDAVVHLVGVEGDPGAGSESQLKVEHFALAAFGRRTFETMLEQRGERFSVNRLDDFGIVQYNVWDPDGNHIHVDFSASDEE
jgi:catechol 2,3-dioxygenase-like lactoylglutathione lyase family enzyme